MQKKYLIIDSHALCHRARFAMKGKDLSTDEMRTEVIFGFFNNVLRLAELFNTHKFLFAWDSKYRNRRKIYPPYKVKEEEKTEDDIEFDALTYPQFTRIRTEILPAMGFKNNFIQRGLEADDIIASLVLNNDRDFIVISRDSDLFQLLDRCQVYDYQTGKMMTRNKFVDNWGISPVRWAEAKAIAGCRSDKIEGIEGVGEKTAVKYLLGRLKESAAAYANIKKGSEIIDRNKKLVTLPYEGTKVYKVYKDKLESFKFFRVFEELDFRTFTRSDEFQKWERSFKL